MVGGQRKLIIPSSFALRGVLQLTLVMLFLQIRLTKVGLGPTSDSNTLLKTLYEYPSDYRCGYLAETVGQIGMMRISKPRIDSRSCLYAYTRSTGCGSRIAYLQAPTSAHVRGSHNWICVKIPSSPSGRNIMPIILPICSSDSLSILPTVLSMFKEWKSLFEHYPHHNLCTITGAEWGSKMQKDPYSVASFTSQVGNPACWPLQALLYVSDGGGTTDQERERKVQEFVNKELESIPATAVAQVSFLKYGSQQKEWIPMYRRS